MTADSTTDVEVGIAVDAMVVQSIGVIELSSDFESCSKLKNESRNVQIY